MVASEFFGEYAPLQEMGATSPPTRSFHSDLRSEREGLGTRRNEPGLDFFWPIIKPPLLLSVTSGPGQRDSPIWKVPGVGINFLSKAYLRALVSAM